MRFIKMHGAGNDYVYFDCFEGAAPKDPGRIAELVSRPHFGIGADGLILIEPSSLADARMRIFNADGSEGKMCGNGIRCVGKYLYDTGIARHEMLSVETQSGVKNLRLTIEDGVATGARVNMGVPVLETARIPVSTDAATIVDQKYTVGGKRYDMTCVSMGNPHAVLIVDELPEDAEFFRVGRLLEHDPMFPERVNVEFAKVLSRESIAVRVWERGSGETLACGSGACASLVACAINGYVERSASVTLTGGVLEIEWAADEHVYMTGPAVTVFRGEIDLP